MEARRPPLPWSLRIGHKKETLLTEETRPPHSGTQRNDGPTGRQHSLRPGPAAQKYIVIPGTAREGSITITKRIQRLPPAILDYAQMF